MSVAQVYLIPTVLHPDAMHTIAPYIVQAIQQCTVFFAENEKTARRFFKKLWPEMVIDNYQWYAIHKAEDTVKAQFIQHVQAGHTIGIISEAGCPGVADPGQLLVAAAQMQQANIHPLVGPNSILLALMASGLNGQHFQFHGYLPIDAHERRKTLRQLEEHSIKTQCTQIFIETPYRNNQLLADIQQSCRATTKLCLGINLTAPNQRIVTQTVAQWKTQPTDIHKQLAVFLLGI